MTKQRRVILDIIKKSMDHLTADQIYQQAKQVIPSIAIGTVYRNLNLMVESGEITRVSIPKEPDRFDKNTMDHDHMICEGCGSIIDIELVDADKRCMKQMLENYTGKKINNYDITIKYFCDECINKTEEVQTV